MKKYKFNMVEIALAMVIIALGISGVLGLFSAGVNAKKEAISENNIADAAEYVLGLCRAVVLNKYEQGDVNDFTIISADENKNKGTEPISIGISEMQNISSNIFEVKDGATINFSPAAATTIPSTFVYAPSRWNSDSNVRIADCEIAGAVWKTQIPVAKKVGDDVSEKKIPYKYGVRIYLELSWPLEKKHDNRDKKIFVMDVMNPNPVLKITNSSSQTP